MQRGRLGFLALILLGIALFFWFDLGRYLDLAYLAGEREQLQARFQAAPLTSLGLFMLMYAAVTGLSLPGAAVLTLAAGALFGFWAGLVAVSLASTLGATLAFLMSRFILRDWVQNRFGRNLAALNRGMEKEGSFYLFTLRLVPLFPFFVINLAMGLTPIRVTTYAWVSMVGMLPGTMAYVNAGTQLGQLESASGILSPALLGSFVLLGLFPLIAKRAVDAIKARRVYADWQPPAHFDRNLVVIGAGAAGLVTSYIAAVVRARVTLVERARMGGDCLNTGCVPSKALLRSARAAHEQRTAGVLGLRSDPPQVDFAAVMERVQAVIQRIEPHDSVERYEGLGVECRTGNARLVSPWQVEIDGEPLTARTIVLATGARPAVPPIPGIEKTGYLTSDTVWSLRELPGRLLVIGGGPIGCELAQAFARLGSKVTIVDLAERLLPREDPDVSALMGARFQEEGIELLLGRQPGEFLQHEGEKVLLVSDGDVSVRVGFDELLVCTGRAARTEGMGLEELGIERAANGTLRVNEYLQTRFPNILACGDVAGPYQFTHVASHQAWYAAVNGLFGRFWRFRVDYSVIPWCTFTDPEVARVGINETEAADNDTPFELVRYDLADLDRALADEAAQGFVKVLVAPGTDRILGATVVGHNAGETINEFVLAMRHGLGLNKILGTIHIYPTMSEGNKFAAGAWKQAHAPEKVLCLLGWFHGLQAGPAKAAASPKPAAPQNEE